MYFPWLLVKAVQWIFKDSFFFYKKQIFSQLITESKGDCHHCRIISFINVCIFERFVLLCSSWFFSQTDVKVMIHIYYDDFNVCRCFIIVWHRSIELSHDSFMFETVSNIHTARYLRMWEVLCLVLGCVWSSPALFWHNVPTKRH
jgi:hypothetical protein